MSTLTPVSIPERIPGEPVWIEPSFRITPGRDPLGLQTITIDRIMPVLVPGILALSRRARYISYYPFLLDEFKRRKLTPSMRTLSTFIKQREYEYALAVHLCPRGCGAGSSGAVGSERVRSILRYGVPPFSRAESVESHLGGYGLYYRTPLIDLGIVARQGTELRDSDETIPIDVLADQLGIDLADAFREAIADTTYYRDYMATDDPIPKEVLVELAHHACLCRLDDAPHEQSLIREAVLGSEPGAHAHPGAGQRRRSFALFLSLIPDYPELTSSDAMFRHAIWDTFQRSLSTDTAYSNTLAQWAALITKEYLQEGMSSIWLRLCRMGLSSQPVDGFAPAELDAFLVSRLADGDQLSMPGTGTDVTGDMPLVGFKDRVIDDTSDMSLEDVHQWAGGRW